MEKHQKKEENLYRQQPGAGTAADCARIHIVGIDNMNDYYDVSIKEYRLKQIEELAAETAKEQAGAGAAGRRAGSGKTVSRFRLDFCEGQHCG